MLAHLTFPHDTYRLVMDARALTPDCLIDVDPVRYRAELAAKEAILASDHRYYAQAPPETAAMQWEAITLLLPNMARYYPAHFALATAGDEWRWANRLLGTETAFTLGDATTLPLAPLDWLGRQVQEDLCLMDGALPGTPLVAGHLCFAGGWCLDDMRGRSFLGVHEAVPEFAARIGRSADLAMQRLKAARPIARVNWGVVGTDALDCSPRATGGTNQWPETLTVTNAGTHCFLRSEWQTLVRLPETRAVLFTIRTRVTPLATARAHPADARKIAALLRTMSPEIRAVKGLSDPILHPILAYLDAIVRDVREESPDA